MHEVSTFVTPTQVALLVCFVVVGPTLGLAGALVSWRRARSPLRGFFAVCGAGWVSWFVACGIASFLFPRYPVDGEPSEVVVFAMTVPLGLVAAAAILWLLSREAAPARGMTGLARLKPLALAASIAAGLLVWGVYEMKTWPARRRLPLDAVVVEEWAMEDGFLPDYSYRLRARMRERDFEGWARSLDLVPAGPRTFEGVDEHHERRASFADGVATYEASCCY